MHSRHALFAERERSDRAIALFRALEDPLQEITAAWLRPAESVLASCSKRLYAINPWREWTKPDRTDISTPQRHVEHLSPITKAIQTELIAVLNVEFALYGDLRRSILKRLEQQHDTKRAAAPFVAAELALAHRGLDEVSARPLSIDKDHAWIPFALSAAARAPLCCLERSEPDVFDAVANMGAGNLLRVHVLRFELESATPLSLTNWHDRRSGCWLLDGGDLVVILEKQYCDLLEGTALPARAKRHEQSRQSDDDDTETSGADSDSTMCDDYGHYKDDD